MTVLQTALDPRSPQYLAARATMLTGLAALDHALDSARDSGGERAVTRHHARGKLLARERIELLVDRDSPLLEFGSVAGWGGAGPVGAGVVTAIGVVEQRLCVLAATEPTLPGAAVTAIGLRKLRRAQQIARHNRLPMISLYELAGADWPAGAEPASEKGHAAAAYHLLGEVIVGYARLTAARLPTVGVFFDGAEFAGIDLTAGLDQLVTVGAHSIRRPADLVADDDRDAARLVRQSVRWWPVPRRSSPIPAPHPKPDPEDLLAAPVEDPLEILARLLDGSEFTQLPGDGGGLCTGWGTVHGHRLAVLTHTGKPCGRGEVAHATRLVERAGRDRTPLLALTHAPATGGADPAIAAAVVRARVPTVVVRVAGWPDVAALAATARFRFGWPVPASAPAESTPAGCSLAGPVESALAGSGQLLDDGVIDPRDTRDVLGICLAVIGHRR